MTIKRGNFDRDYKIAKLVIEGQTYKEAARDAGVSGQRARDITIKHLRRSVYPKFSMDFFGNDSYWPINKVRENKKFWLKQLSNYKKRMDKSWLRYG